MGRSLDLQPQDAWKIRNAMAAQVTAHVLAALPIGYWQRRVAARAWSLERMPVIPRESQHVQAWRQPGPPSTWVLSTEVMMWGLIPWMWRGDARTDVAEARLALQRFARMAGRPTCAAIFIAPDGMTGPRRHLPRLRMAACPGRAGADGWATDAGSMAIGVITWPELADVFAEATTSVRSLRGRDAAAYGARQLELLAQASSA